MSLVSKISNKKGFTIIEIVVVISLMTIFMTFSLGAYSTFNQEKQLNKEIKSVYQLLKNGKKYAVTPDLRNCQNFKGYEVAFDKDKNLVELKRCCASECLAVNKYIIETPVKISKLSSNEIKFIPDARGADKNFTLELKHLTMNKCINLSVSRTAVIDGDESSVLCK